ncbi:AfsR/SARP family transcriptional regulator [Sphaerisporangium aureirubrum]|uniref:Tetratricopeptide repeat protein n=1 Tax=Sphaerisporangium aureirubrum TaxID=1544736 RepID=A0ABW1NVI5_9ACTN
MEFRLLGPGVGVTLSVDGREYSLGSPIQQFILALLLLEPGRSIAAEAMVDRVWGHWPPPKARGNLSIYISRLRGILRTAVGEAAVIRTHGSTYALEVDSKVVDLSRFRLLKTQATAVAESGDPELAIRLLREAEGVWPGDALAGLPGDWARRMAETLARERAGAVRLRIDLELRLGRHAEVLDELYRLVAVSPVDEVFAAQLMTALYRSDRRGEALRLYLRVHRQLWEENGTGPGDGLRGLHKRILRGDPGLAVTPVYRRGDTEPQPDTLLCDNPDFTGRRPEMDAVRAMRDERQSNLVIALQGRPGVGKTALAVHIAHRFRAGYPDACLYLDLRAHAPALPPLTTAAALHQLLRQLDIPPQRIPSSLDERAAMWRAESAYRRAIVILDDVVGPEQIGPLLGGQSAGLMLITSRAPFDAVPGVRCLTLEAMPGEEAAELAARLMGPGAGPGDVRRVVRHSGGVPLMITLLAGGVATPGPEPGAEVLDAGLDLGAEEELAFRRLGLHPCKEVTVDVAAALCDVPPDRAHALIEALVAHRLLQETGAGRYRFHDLVRGHAHDRARAEDSPGDIRRAVTRLLDHYLCRTRKAADAIRRADAPGPGLHGSGDPAVAGYRKWMTEEWETVLSLAQYAAEHEWRSHCVELTRAMTEFLDTEGHWEEAAAAHGLAVHVCRETGDRAGVAQASLDLGFVRFRTGRHAEALTHTREALALCQSLGDRRAEARCLDQIGFVLWASAEYREALGYLEEARAIHHAVGDVKGEADALGHGGIVYWHLGRYRDSLDRLSRALELYRRIGDRRAEAKALNNMGDVYKRRGLHRDAVRLYQESMTIFEQIAGRQNHAILHNNLGDVHQYKGRYGDALDCYRKAMTTLQEMGDRRNQADILNSIGKTYLDMNLAGESVIHFEKARGLAAVIRDSYQDLRAQMGIGDVHYMSGRHLEALGVYQQAKAMAQTIEDPYQLAQLYVRMAMTQEYLEGKEAARICWRQAHLLFDELDLPEAEDIDLRLRGLDDEPPGL